MRNQSKNMQICLILVAFLVGCSESSNDRKRIKTLKGRLKEQQKRIDELEKFKRKNTSNTNQLEPQDYTEAQAKIIEQDSYMNKLRERVAIQTIEITTLKEKYEPTSIKKESDPKDYKEAMEAISTKESELNDLTKRFSEQISSISNAKDEVAKTLEDTKLRLAETTDKNALLFDKAFE